MTEACRSPAIDVGSAGADAPEILAAGGLADRKRSASPCRRALAMDMRRLASLLREPGAVPSAVAWEAPERGSVPVTPTGATASRLAVQQQQQLGSLVEQVSLLAASQRQYEADRRRLLHVERRMEVLGEEKAREADSREKWAEVQGIVTGLLEEMQALSRRVDGLDERLWARTSANGLSKQRSRELEQQVQVLEQQSRLAAVASEEVQKRQAGKLRRVDTQQEEILRRVNKVEEELWKRGGLQAGVGLDVQVRELQEQQERVEMDMQGLQLQIEEALQEIGANLGQAGPASAEFQVADHAIAALEKRMGSQIEDLASSLANLRIKVDGQLQRSASLADRLQSAQEPLIDSLRNEVAHARTQSRREMDQELAVFRERVQHLSDRLDDIAGESEQAHQAHAGFGGVNSALIGALEERLRASEEDMAEVRNLLLEGHGLPPGNVEEVEALGGVASLFQRLDLLEERVASPPTTSSLEGGVDRKTDARVLQVHESLLQIREEIGRLRERDSSGEARMAGFQQQLQQLQSSMTRRQLEQERPVEAVVELDAKLSEVTKLVSELAARLLEVESALESGESDLGMAHAPPSFSAQKPLNESGDHGVQRLQEQLQEMISRVVVLERQVQEEEIGEVLQEARAEVREAKRVLKEREREDIDFGRGRDPAPQPMDRLASEALQALPAELDAIRLMKVELKNALKTLHELESRVAQATSSVEGSTEVRHKEEAALSKLERDVAELARGLAEQQELSAGRPSDSWIETAVMESAAFQNLLDEKLRASMADNKPEIAEPAEQEKLETLCLHLRRDLEQTQEQSESQSERLSKALERLEATEEKALWLEHECRQRSKEVPVSQLQAELSSADEKHSSQLREHDTRLVSVEAKLKDLASTSSSTGGLAEEVKELTKQATQNAESIKEHRRELDGTLASLHGLSDRLTPLSSLPERVEALAKDRPAEVSTGALESIRAEIRAIRQESAGSPSGTNEHIRTQVQLKAAALTARISEELGSLQEHQNGLDLAMSSLKALSTKVDTLMGSNVAQNPQVVQAQPASESSDRVQKLESTVSRLSREMDQLLGPRRVGITLSGPESNSTADETSPSMGVAEARALREQLDTVCQQVKDLQEKYVMKGRGGSVGADGEGSFNLSLTEQVGTNSSREGSLNLSLTELAKDDSLNLSSTEPAEVSDSARKAADGPSNSRGTSGWGSDALDRMLGSQATSSTSASSGSSSLASAQHRSSRIGQEKRKPHALTMDDSLDSRLSPVAEEGDGADDGSATAASVGRVVMMQDTKGVRLGGSGSLESQSGDSLGVSYSMSCQEMSMGVDFSVEDSLELEKCDYIEEVQAMPPQSASSKSSTDQADSAGGSSNSAQHAAAGSASSGSALPAAKGASGTRLLSSAQLSRPTTAGILGTSDIASASQPASGHAAASTASGNAMRISSGGRRPGPGLADEAWDHAQDASESYDEGSFEEEESVEESISAHSSSSSD